MRKAVGSIDSRWLAILVGGLVLLHAVDASAQQRRGPRGGGRPGAGCAADGDSGERQDGVKPYDEVITKEAVSRPGLFLTHQIDEKIFYEIPTAKLDKDMLWVVSLAKTQAGYSYGGMPVRDRVVRWELRGEKILLRDVKYAIRADVKDSVQVAVDSTSVAPIIKVFSVKAWGKDKAPVIDVTSIFTSDVSEFSAKRSLGGGNMDSSRTFLDEVKAFPENIETKVLATYSVSATPTATRGGRGPSTPRPDSSQSGVTALVHHSMRMLPEDPMTPRVKDERVGFFSVGFQDYGNFGNHQTEEVKFITRWRLEKKDPSAKVSEPVKPIVFFVGRGVPDKWKPYMIKGIEMWKPAFEKAGFKNAIQGKLAPSPQEDPSWDAEDARISTIRWLPSTTENAFGPHVHDPRTGEILEADVRMYHNVMKLARDWYFVQASPNDKRAQQLPLPDDLVGELLAYIVAHEVGHSIGFPHNMKASSAFTVENLRDPEFTKKHGVEASIMDYGRFNYVAQPGDGAALIPKVGPYDYFAVDWGYRQFADPKAEKQGLAKLVAKQIKNPMLRFGDADSSQDPTRQTEDLGSDSVAATALGMKNIDRVAEYLVKACCKPGEDYDLLQNMYDQLVRQRTRELMHVTGVIAGFEQKNLYFGDADQIYHPISAERQRQAVAFLVEHAFQTPQKLIDPSITMRLEPAGAADRILSSQRSILRALLNGSRVGRMAEHAHRAAASGDEEVYDCLELMKDLRSGIWSELDSKPVAIDIYRRNLQRAHVELLSAQLKGGASDMTALARAELEVIKSLASRRAEQCDGLPQAHLKQVVADIKQALEAPVVSVAPAAEAAPTRRRGAEDF